MLKVETVADRISRMWRRLTGRERRAQRMEGCSGMSGSCRDFCVLVVAFCLAALSLSVCLGVILGGVK